MPGIYVLCVLVVLPGLILSAAVEHCAEFVLEEYILQVAVLMQPAEHCIEPVPEDCMRAL